MTTSYDDELADAVSDFLVVDDDSDFAGFESDFDDESDELVELESELLELESFAASLEVDVFVELDDPRLSFL